MGSRSAHSMWSGAIDASMKLSEAPQSISVGYGVIDNWGTETETKNEELDIDDLREIETEVGETWVYARSMARSRVRASTGSGSRFPR